MHFRLRRRKTFYHEFITNYWHIFGLAAIGLIFLSALLLNPNWSDLFTASVQIEKPGTTSVQTSKKEVIPQNNSTLNVPSTAIESEKIANPESTTPPKQIISQQKKVETSANPTQSIEQKIEEKTVNTDITTENVIIPTTEVPAINSPTTEIPAPEQPVENIVTTENQTITSLEAEPLESMDGTITTISYSIVLSQPATIATKLFDALTVEIPENMEEPDPETLFKQENPIVSVENINATKDNFESNITLPSQEILKDSLLYYLVIQAKTETTEEYSMTKVEFAEKIN